MADGNTESCEETIVKSHYMAHLLSVLNTLFSDRAFHLICHSFLLTLLSGTQLLTIIQINSAVYDNGQRVGHDVAGLEEKRKG